MCLWLEVINGSESDCATNTDELIEALGCGLDGLVSKSGSPIEAEQCLCDLDVEATAARHGYRVDWSPEFGGVDLVKVDA